MEHDFYYKCRRCGEVITVTKKTFVNEFLSQRTISEYEMDQHKNCLNSGSRGIMDLIGYDMKEAL